MLKYLRIAVTALCLTACVLLVALWVRSYWKSDRFHVYCYNRVTMFGSNYGYFYVIHTKNIHGWSVPKRFGFGSGDAKKFSATFQLTTKYGGIAGKMKGQAPYWFVTPLVFAVAAVPWLPSRFSLRTLLIATTLVAVGLGAIVMAM